MTHFTPTQQRIMDKLNTGGAYSKYDLFECLDDDLAEPEAVCVHITNLRKKLRLVGLAIICEIGERRDAKYRLTRILSNPNRE